LAGAFDTIQRAMTMIRRANNPNLNGSRTLRARAPEADV
jgi:hypothetical protein